MEGHVTLTLKIVNEKGLHARASARLAELVEGFDAEATVSKDGLSVTGDSIMGLLMLAAVPRDLDNGCDHWGGSHGAGRGDRGPGVRRLWGGNVGAEEPRYRVGSGGSSL